MNKEFIIWFNKNKSKEEYRKVINSLNLESKCRICNDVIYYYDSGFIFSKGIIKLKGKSFESSKKLYSTYNLTVCEDCLSNNFPEYQSKNKSRVFNQMNYITEFAFNINRDDSLKWMKEKYAITEKNLINKWGDEIGRKKWTEYCQKQSYTNTFEYKRDKYGWDENDFKSYNKSRSVTIENLIKRHGEERGMIIWNEYCEKQRFSTTINYFIDKYGNDKGTEVYENFCKKRLFGAGYSKVSYQLFEKVSEYFNKYTLFYGENEWFSYDNVDKRYYLVDFYIKELNIAVEFNGDIWHANPKKYGENDKPFPFQKDIKSIDIWKRDKIKNDFLKTKFNKLIIIWESDLYNDGIEQTVNKILKEINE